MDARDKLNGFWIVAACLVGLAVAGATGGGLLTIMVVGGVVVGWAMSKDYVR